jgi:hypothetical protein
MSQTEVVEKSETYIFMYNNFFFENGAVYEIMWKNMVDRQATHDNTIFCRKDALCMLDN